MNSEIGFGRRVLDVFERLGVSYEHMPSGIDTCSVVVDNGNLGDKRDQVVEDRQRCGLTKLPCTLTWP